MRTLRTSVRRLVEFLLRSGNIDAERDGRGGIEAMQAGSNIHRTLQAAGGRAYQAEVSLADAFFFPDGSFSPHAARLQILEEAVRDQAGFFLRVEGRADGIIDDGTHPLLVDEIKGVSRDVSAIDEPEAIHEAQALCYAYLYLRGTRGSTTLGSAFGDQVTVRLTYVSMTTGEMRQIERAYAVPDIEAWFFQLLRRAQRWAAWRVAHDKLRGRSLHALAFPLEAREGQRQIMDGVTRAIHAGRRLYVQAPTGSGKTIATLYPALKAMGANEVPRIAYLTAKTTTRQSALECLDLLRQQGLSANVLVVTARNKICPIRRNAHDADVRARPLASLCNPLECPLARGHYDAVNDALFEAISTHGVLDATCVTNVAAHHHVCPYELQRDAARWADVIVCDYHYAFAPSAGLLGVANEPSGAGTVYLVDEAHNLAERMRKMYRAELAVCDLEGMERLLRKRGTFATLAQTVRDVILTFPTWDKALPANARPNSRGRGGRVRGGQPDHQKVHISDAFVGALEALSNGIDTALEQPPFATGGSDGHGKAPDGSMVETYLALRDMGLGVRSLLGALQRAEVGYVTYLARAERGGRKLRICCVDPSHDLEERLEQAKAAVFFSGTLLPMEYHRDLLGAQDGDESLHAPSSFDYRRQQVLVGTDVSARYSRRGPQLYAHIAAYLVTLVQARPGNYLVFLPSYAMAGEVARAYAPIAGDGTTVVQQHSGMFEDERERFVARFRQEHGTTRSLVGLCVLGGIFGESIDLPGESLVGVVVVGTGMPRATAEREVIREYFDAKGSQGFVYAYTYPGLIKVLQAAGRLMRTEKDHGTVLLLDDRFMERELRSAFPAEWTNVQACTLQTLPGLLARA